MKSLETKLAEAEKHLEDVQKQFDKDPACHKRRLAEAQDRISETKTDLRNRKIEPFLES